LVESVHFIKRHTEASLVASRKMGLEVSAEKTVKVMSVEQQAGQNHNIQISNKP